MSKRVSLKGKGIDIFTNPEEKKGQPAVTPLHQHTSKPVNKLTKATFYLTEQAIDGLDEIWIKVRREKKGVSKSFIVAQVLEKAIKDLRGKPAQDVLKFLD